MNEKKKQLLLDLLKHRKEQVELYRSQIEYGEWSCGQQDADAEQAEQYDKVMTDAIKATEDNTYRDTLSKYEIEDVNNLVKEVIEDFRFSAEYYLSLQ